MARNFAEIAFTDAVKRLQEKHGSRSGYERMEKFSEVNGLTDQEMSAMMAHRWTKWHL